MMSLPCAFRLALISRASRHSSKPQNLRWFAPVEADCPHNADGGRGSAHDTSPGSARVRNGSDIVPVSDAPWTDRLNVSLVR
jgi:hypothetical protein